MKYIKGIKEYISKEKELIKHLLLILVTGFLVTPVLPFFVMLIYFELGKVRKQKDNTEIEIRRIKEEIEQLKKNDFENYKELSKKIDFEIDKTKEKQPNL